MQTRKLAQCALAAALTLVGIGGLPTAAPSVLVSPARAAAPLFVEIDETFTDYNLSELCGFPVEVRFQSRLMLQETGETISTVDRVATTYTNLDNGRSVTVKTAGQTRIFVDEETGEASFLFTGVAEQMVIPGQGVVALRAGQHGFIVYFDPETGEFVLENVDNGTTQEPSPSLDDLICEALAD